MNLKEQLYVCTLARCQTISKAAEELYISQPALSVYISNLEKYLGIKLFERTGKCFLLTPIGEEYVRRAEQMLKMKEEFDRLVEQAVGMFSGRIRVGIQMRRAITMAPLVAARFMKEYPDIDLVFREGTHRELVKMYMENSIDLLLCIYKDELPGADYIEVGEEQVLVALPCFHEANQYAYHREGERFGHLDISRLDRETFILPQEGQSLRTTAERILEQARIRPGRVIEISNFETIIAMVENGLGIGFNRLGYVGNMDRFRNVNYYYVGDQPYSSRLVIAYRREYPFEPCTCRWVELLKEHCGLSNGVGKSV